MAEKSPNPVVGAPRLELGTSCSQSKRATNCATPRKIVIILYFKADCQARLGAGLAKKNPWPYGIPSSLTTRCSASLSKPSAIT